MCDCPFVVVIVFPVRVQLAQRLLDGLHARVPKLTLNGHATKRYVGNLNLSFGGVEGESLLMGVPEVPAPPRSLTCVCAPCVVLLAL